MQMKVATAQKSISPKFCLRWLDRLKNEDSHQIYDFFENKIFKTLEHL